MAKRVASAHARGCVLRYVGTLDIDGGTKLTLVDVPLDHPFAMLRGPEVRLER